MTKYIIYTALPGLLILTTAIWLIVTLVRRSRWRRWAAGLFAVEVLVLLALYLHFLSPRSYPRTYVDAVVPEALAPAATNAGFFIGAAVNKSTNPDYAKLVPSQFNSITPENATKWRQMLVDGEIGSYDFTEADAIVDYAVENGVRVRGHTLIWGKFSGRTYPKALDERIAGADNPEAELRRVMRDHITTVLDHFRGRIAVWDCVNEPLSMDGPYLDRNLFLNTLGRVYIAEAFRIAHEVDPTLQLFLNEQFGNYEGENVEVFFDLLEWLVEEGVPIHGVGIQAHNIFKTHDLAAFRRFVQRVADLGLLVEVTEFDARIRLFEEAEDPYRAQGEYTAAYAGACIETPACIGFTAWGLSDAGTWFDFVPPFRWMPPNDPLLFDTELRPKPAVWKVVSALSKRQKAPSEI